MAYLIEASCQVVGIEKEGERELGPEGAGDSIQERVREREGEL